MPKVKTLVSPSLLLGPHLLIFYAVSGPVLARRHTVINKADIQAPSSLLFSSTLPLSPQLPFYPPLPSPSFKPSSAAVVSTSLSTFHCILHTPARLVPLSHILAQNFQMFPVCSSSGHRLLSPLLWTNTTFPVSSPTQIFVTLLSWSTAGFFIHLLRLKFLPSTPQTIEERTSFSPLLKTVPIFKTSSIIFSSLKP